MSAVATARPAASGRVRPERILVEGAEIGVLSLGPADAPPVLLVHGFSGDMLTWQFNMAPLARDHRVIAIDLPGHGLSSAAPGIGHWQDMTRWLARLIGALGLDRPHLVGHSLGGRLALGVVEQRLVAARSLSLISCAGISPDHDYAFLRRLSEVSTLDEAIACSRHLFGGAKLDVERFARALLQKLELPDTCRALAHFLDRNFADGVFLPIRPTDWRALSCPFQLIWGRDDQVVKLPAPEWLPDRQAIHLLDEVGHLPHMAASNQVNGLLGSLIRGIKQEKVIDPDSAMRIAPDRSR